MKNWRKYNGSIIPLTPPHIEVDTIGIEKKIKEENVFFARWTSDFDCKEEKEFWYVICDYKLDISDYSKNTRSKIRRGLKNCHVRLVSKSEIIANGFDAYNAAFLNYRSHFHPKTEREFKDEIINLSNEWEFWAIYIERKMIGFSQNRVIGDYCDYSTIKFHPDYLRFYSSYALFYTMNQYYLNEKNFQYVNDGSRSISHDTNIQEFLIQKFKFRKAYCTLNIIDSYKIKLLIYVFFSFRLILSMLNFGFFIKLNILLNQEKIRRSYER